MIAIRRNPRHLLLVFGALCSIVTLEYYSLSGLKIVHIPVNDLLVVRYMLNGTYSYNCDTLAEACGKSKSPVAITIEGLSSMDG